MLQGPMVAELEKLRERLRALGQRPSLSFPNASPAAVEAIALLERYGPMCEAMYLMMAADGRVLNSERAVLRGALEILSDGEVRTAHMEAMLDAAARASASQGPTRRLEAVIVALQGEPVKAELVLVLSAAVALADDLVTPAERHLFERLSEGLGVGEERVAQLLTQLTVNS
ncbi:MAG TPA: TerB family tellurite resistance protein [Polyangiaceae bacterium]|nr:TerB family tellurite resistance protein [Polyangiaceae bacterium]